MNMIFAIQNEQKYVPDEDAETSSLVKRAVNGDADAFGTLVQKYESFVYNIAYNSIGNGDDAYDVSQEAFLKAYKAIKKFRGDCKFSTWLYKITVNASKDNLRGKSKRRAVSLSDWTDEDEGNETSYLYKPPDIIDESVGVNPEEALEHNEKIELVREAVASLSEDHRSIIVLRDIEGYSYEDISEMLNIEIGTVKSRLNRARASVKKYLTNRNFTYS